MTTTPYVPKHLARPLHDLDASAADECLACVLSGDDAGVHLWHPEDGWPGEGPDEWRDPPEEAIDALLTWINYPDPSSEDRTRAARDIRELAALGFVWKGTI